MVTWNDLPRWVQKQRNWYRKFKDIIGTPDEEPEGREDELSQTLKRLHEAAAAKVVELAPQPPQWFEFDGDKVAQDVLVGWIEHLRCPVCDISGPGDFGPEWGTVVCSVVDCEQVWRPDWFTPWGPPTPKSKNPQKYSFGECPMCGKANRRMNPESPYAFVCHLPSRQGFSPRIDLFAAMFDPGGFERDMERRQELQEEWNAIYEVSCQNRYLMGLREGWYRFLPVSFPFCQGCGVLFAARLPDQEFCSKECGPMPQDYSRRLRKLAAGVSPTLRRQEVFERDDWMCHICGEKADPQALNRLDRPSLDHVVPIAAGGTHTTDNVKTAHLGCNIKKSDAVLDEDELAFLRTLLVDR